jgi:hypothetical protein
MNADRWPPSSTSRQNVTTTLFSYSPYLNRPLQIWPRSLWYVHGLLWPLPNMCHRELKVHRSSWWSVTAPSDSKPILWLFSNLIIARGHQQAESLPGATQIRTVLWYPLVWPSW